MKKIILAMAVCVWVIGLTAGCGGHGKAASGDDSGSSISGAKHENFLFSAVIPSGWKVFGEKELEKGRIWNMLRIQPEKDLSMSAPSIHLKFEGKKNWAGTPKSAIEQMAKDYNGTPAEKIAYNGIEFFQTTYEYSGIKQTMLVSTKNGNKITVTLVGKDYDKNPAIKRILKTISFK